jgi:uncharacterized protein (TIGR02996 family)
VTVLDAVEALRSGDRETALEALLGCWRERPVAVVADAIDMLSARVEAVAPPPEAGWMAALRDWRPARHGALYRTLGAEGPQEAARRLQVLRATASDPRVSRALCGWLVRPPFTEASSGLTWQLAMAQLGRIPDVRSRKVMAWAGASDGLPDFVRSEVRGAMLTLPRRSPPLPDAWLRPLDELRELAEADDDVERDLLHRVWAQPDDWNARAVYADVLLTRGDARGELIALQAPNPQHYPARERRIAALLARHASHWLGPLRGAMNVNTVRFEGGFPVSGALRVSVEPRVVGHPAWGTIQTVTLPPEYTPRSFSVVCHPAMRGMRGVFGLRLADLPALLRVHALTLEQLGLAGRSRFDATQIPSMKQLRVLQVSMPAPLEVLLGLAPSLDTLRINAPMGQARPLPFKLRQTFRSNLRTLDLCVMHADEVLWRCVAERSAPRAPWNAHVEVWMAQTPWRSEFCLALLRDLVPTWVRTVTIHTRNPTWARANFTGVLPNFPRCEVRFEELGSVLLE